MSQITKIYLDMDGVIADFEERWHELYGAMPPDKDHEFRPKFKPFIENGNFATLKLMPGAIELLHFLECLDIPTEILSSTGTSESYLEISKQKKQWLDLQGIDFVQNFVPGKAHKWEFATPTSVIIDDTTSVIRDWVQKGKGIGILHVSAENTLSLLKKLVS